MSVKTVKIVRAKRPMSLQVLVEDTIGAARASDPDCSSNCVAARACKSFPWIRSVQIGEKITKIVSVDGTITKYRTSAELRRDIQTWDAGKPWPFATGETSKQYMLLPMLRERTPEEKEKGRQRNAERLAKAQITSTHKINNTSQKHKTLGRTLRPFRTDELADSAR